MKPYCEKLKDPRWQKTRLRVLERDSFACRNCGATDKTLHVHHCYYSKGDPWQTPDSLLLCLCEDCHDKRQEMENDGRKMLGQIFARCPDIEGLVGSLARIATAKRPPTCLFSDDDMLERANLGADFQKQQGGRQ